MKPAKKLLALEGVKILKINAKVDRKILTPHIRFASDMTRRSQSPKERK